MCKTNHIWNHVSCSCENDKYLRSIIDDSVITCDEIIEETKTIPTKSISAKTIPTKITSTKTVLTKCTSTDFYILLTFILIIIALLIAASIYCYLIKYQAKQKPLLPCHYTSSKLKETGY